jgi:hypothetical protein
MSSIPIGAFVSVTAIHSHQPSSLHVSLTHLQTTSHAVGHDTPYVASPSSSPSPSSEGGGMSTPSPSCSSIICPNVGPTVILISQQVVFHE